MFDMPKCDLLFLRLEKRITQRIFFEAEDGYLKKF